MPTLLPPIALSYPDQNASVYEQTQPPTQPAERPGFPTYAQYKQIENTYIQSLTPRRQGKALISQSMFDRIWDVLHHPESQMETAQFRFWARKMFTVNKEYRITLGVPEGVEVPPQEVLLHDNLLVAVQEQLYDLLCFCHGSTGHGGRDKTCALIRKHYTWVPKDLVSNFIKACPTCIMKKCGNVDVNSPIPKLIAEVDRMSARLIAQEDSLSDIGSPSHSHLHHLVENAFPKLQPTPIAFQDTTNQDQVGHMSWSSLARNRNLAIHSPHLMSSEHMQNSVVDASTGYNRASTHSPNENVFQNSNPYQLVPMVREVSLYRGLPNGWQYRHDDFETAHAEFMEYKNQWDSSAMADEMDGSSDPLRPRIPSIAGLWTPDQFRNSVKEEEEELELLYSTSVGQQHQHQRFIMPPMARSLDISNSDLPPLLQNMGSHHITDGFVPQIDPALLAMSGVPVDVHHGNEVLPLMDDGPTSVSHSHSLSHRPTPEIKIESEPHSDHNQLPVSNSFKRAGAPPPLDLDMLATEQSFQELLAYRHINTSDPGEWGHVTQPPNPSPTSSVDSYGSMDYSPLSLSDSPTETPDTSAATTPVEEGSQSKLEADKGVEAALKNVDSHAANAKPEPVDEIDLGLVKPEDLAYAY
ncbi:hypothetical protein FA15DRAFT_636054 [Coprinopsis marcescibilis]|uniref:Integrase zinc-binding domain-containing protein n=1 Tax=Coprinopsis marcescibilis TaxID=230819 RepID=A0A5C3L3J9_COPMA|nr:hypothetical protein FA15DRAFT_636054 [Coprinopsis marcescibilis]